MVSVQRYREVATRISDCERESATVNKPKRRREEEARVESRVAIKSIGIRSYRNVQRKTNNNSFPLVRKGKERLVIVDRRVINKKKKKKKNGMTQGESSLRIPRPRVFVKMHNLSQDNVRFITSLPRLVY